MDKVYTVKVSAVNEAVLKRFAKKAGLDLGGSLSDLIKRFVEHTKASVKAGTIPNDRLGRCDVCGGYSDLLLAECPYCGSSESDSETKEEEKPNDGPTDTATTPEEAAAKEEKPVAKKKEKKAEKPVEEPKESAVVRRKRSEAKKKDAALEPEAKDEVVEKSTEEKPVAKAGGIKPYTEADLDSAVANLAKAAVETVRGLYQYGKELQRISDLDLWKLRLGGKYRTFEIFCREELKISRQHAYRIMAVTRSYTETQLEKYGLMKLNLALQLPAELRTKVLGDGKKSLKEMSERAKALARGEDKSRQTPAIDKSKAVTVAIVPGIVEVPMQKRPKEADRPIGEPTEPATSLRVDPWFRLPLTNNVVLTVRLTRNDKGEIIAIVEHRRREETA